MKNTTPIVFETCTEMTEFSRAARTAGQQIGFVPTMGALHEGHASLIRAARAQSDIVVVSIFVNPTQFGPNEDFSRYPKTFEADRELCEQAGGDVVFLPSANEMYPQGFDTTISQKQLPRYLCGAARPGHFDGVQTVCCKLFNIVQPDVAYFGQKDYQQTAVIRRMVADLNMPLEIQICPTVREADGLAMSSRNRYLSPGGRQDALCLYKSLQLARKMVSDGETDADKVLDAMKCLLQGVPSVKIDYVAVVDPATLEPLKIIGEAAVALLAVKIGSTRLIDNMVVGSHVPDHNED